MTKKAVLLAVGHDYPRAEWGLLVSPPLGILALGSYLAVHDVPVELIDMQMDFGFGLTRDAEAIVAQRIARYLHDQADDIAWVGISQLSNNDGGIILIQKIRAALPETPIVFGGYFPSTNYRLLLQKYPFITAIVRGDGEATALEISRRLAQGRTFLSDQTPNLAWLDGSEIRTTPVQSMALDDLPILDFRLLRNRSYYQIINMITSRGCPFHCNYCLESSMRSYAPYPIEWVARQLSHLEAELPNIRRVGISDPIFGVGRKRTLEICQILDGRRFTYGVESRVGVLTPDLIPSLRQAGLELVFWGIESASPATLLRMNKVRSVAEAGRYLEDTMETLKSCFENNVTPFLGIMLGFPGDTEVDLQVTMKFVEEVNQLHNQVTARTGLKTGFVPTPQTTQIYDGSPLAERVVEDFPEVVLRSELIGESIVVSPSPGLDLEELLRYWEDIESQGEYTRQALELIPHYFGFSAKDFVAAHPELTDSEGVTVLCESIRRFPE